MGRDGLSVIQKSAAILTRFVDERVTSLTFNGILTGTPLSRATLHRTLSEMTQHGLLTQDADRDEYRLGPLLLSVGAMAQRLTGVAERALPKMQLLRDQFGETIVLSEMHGAAVVPVRRLDGLHELRMTQEIGRPYPAYAGATGKALLAHLGRDALTNYLADVRLEPLTSSTIRSPEDLRLELDRIRRAGVAVSRGERVPEALAVSAPVRDADAHVVAAMTVSALASRFDPDRTFLAAQAVKDAADAVSLALGHHRRAGEPDADDLRNPERAAHKILKDLCAALWA